MYILYISYIIISIYGIYNHCYQRSSKETSRTKSQALYLFDKASQASIELFLACGIDKNALFNELEDSESDKKKSIHLQTKYIPIFKAVSINPLQHHKSQKAGHNLTSYIKAHNACQEQDKVNPIVEYVVDQEVEERVQTREVIINEVKKATTPLLFKPQSFETKMKNSNGRQKDEVSQPSIVGKIRQLKSTALSNKIFKTTWDKKLDQKTSKLAKQVAVKKLREPNANKAMQ